MRVHGLLEEAGLCVLMKCILPAHHHVSERFDESICMKNLITCAGSIRFHQSSQICRAWICLFWWEQRLLALWTIKLSGCAITDSGWGIPAFKAAEQEAGEPRDQALQHGWLGG